LSLRKVRATVDDTNLLLYVRRSRSNLKLTQVVLNLGNRKKN